MKGKELPDEWVVRGNHHDAWVNGASDPLSGMVAELEEARAIGELHKAGWQPKRTLMFCAWDGEEPGLLGSTEWAETNAKAIQEHVVAYLNTDNSGRGYLGVAGSHTLEKFFNQVAPRRHGPRKRHVGGRAAAGGGAGEWQPRGAAGGPRPGRFSHCCSGVPAPTTRRSFSTWACRR